MTNMEMVKTVAQRLGKLREKVVFLGGAATQLLITDTAASEPRVTLDIDIIVEISTLPEYYSLSESLRELGFTEDTREKAPFCRWLVDGITVDVMPSDEKVLGFSNRWYRPAIDAAFTHEIERGLLINVVSAPFFLATKIEAFNGRGNGDFFGSHDMEDIITLIDGRSEAIDEIAATPVELKTFLADSFCRYLRYESFIHSISGHVLPDRASQARVPGIISKIRTIAKI